MKVTALPAINENHMGGSLEDFLRDEGMFDSVNRHAAKKLLALQLEDERKKIKLSRLQMAKKMHTSPTTLEKIFDPCYASLTLETLESAARAVGCELVVSIRRTANT